MEINPDTGISLKTKALTVTHFYAGKNDVWRRNYSKYATITRCHEAGGPNNYPGRALAIGNHGSQFQPIAARGQKDR
jgi:hypothetical protein